MKRSLLTFLCLLSFVIAQDLASIGLEPGAALYTRHCAGCHLPTGEGVPMIFPPLARHTPLLSLAEGGRHYLILVTLFGVQGEMTVLGETYRGAMPGFPRLSDADVTALLNYILAAWDNLELLPEDYPAITPEEVAAARAERLNARTVLTRRPEPLEPEAIEGTEDED